MRVCSGRHNKKLKNITLGIFPLIVEFVFTAQYFRLSGRVAFTSM